MDRVYSVGGRALDFLSLAWVFGDPVGVPDRDRPLLGHPVADGEGNPPPGARGSHEGLNLSRQEWPPRRISPRDWGPFQVLREHRGLYQSVSLQAIDNPGAGNCFFHSIACAIDELMERDPALQEPLHQEILEIAAGAEALSQQLVERGEGPGRIFLPVADFINHQRGLLTRAAENLGQRPLLQEEVRAWAALQVLIMPPDDLALMESVLGMAGPGVDQVDWESRLLAASEITRDRVMGVDALRHLLCQGVLQGRIGLISMRHPPEGGAEIDGIATRWLAGQLPVIDQPDPDEGQEPTLPETLIVHRDYHFFTVRQPRPPVEANIRGVEPQVSAVQAEPRAQDLPCGEGLLGS